MRFRNLILAFAVIAVLCVAACAGLPLYVVGIIGVLACLLLPRMLFYAYYRRFPLGRGQNPQKVKTGATKDEVLAALGPPHEKAKTGQDRVVIDEGGEGVVASPKETWYYHADPFGIIVYGLNFGKEGRLDKVWW